MSREAGEFLRANTPRRPPTCIRYKSCLLVQVVPAFYAEHTFY